MLNAISAKLERSTWTPPTLKAAPAASVLVPPIAVAALTRDAPRLDSLLRSHRCVHVSSVISDLGSCRS